MAGYPLSRRVQAPLVDLDKLLAALSSELLTAAAAAQCDFEVTLAMRNRRDLPEGLAKAMDLAGEMSTQANWLATQHIAATAIMLESQVAIVTGPPCADGSAAPTVVTMLEPSQASADTMSALCISLDGQAHGQLRLGDWFASVVAGRRDGPWQPVPACTTDAQSP